MNMTTSKFVRRVSLAALIAGLACGASLPANPAMACPSPDSEARTFAASAVSRVAEAEAALRARDLARLLRFVDPEVQVILGENRQTGHAALVRILGDKPELWEQLSTGLHLAKPSVIWGPCTPPLGLEYRFRVGVIPSGGIARTKPSPDAPTLAVGAGEIVYVAGLEGTEASAARAGWIEIHTRDGRTAYIDSSQLRVEATLQIGFAPIKQDWRITQVIISR